MNYRDLLAEHGIEKAPEQAMEIYDTIKRMVTDLEFSRLAEIEAMPDSDEKAILRYAFAKKFGV